jgi:nucleoid-associated protein YgaU
VATPDKAVLREVGGDKKELTFRFNPKELSIGKSATWTRPTSKGARSASKPEFGGVQPQTIQMELLFDDFEHPDKDLTKDIQQLMDWLKPAPKAFNKQKPQPHVLQLLWGANKAINGFHGFLKTVNAKYTMFKPSGRPIRATVQISLEEIPNEPKGQNPTSRAISSQRTHVMVAGDSLMSVAYREYDDPSLWRGLAAFNGIDEPMRVRSGSSLLIPTEDEARSLA